MNAGASQAVTPIPVRRAFLASVVGAIVSLVVAYRVFGTPIVLFSLLLYVAGFLTIFLLAPATRTMTIRVRAGMLGGGLDAAWGSMILAAMFQDFGVGFLSIGAGIGLISGATAGLVFAARGRREVDLERACRASLRSRGHAATMALLTALVVFGIQFTATYGLALLVGENERSESPESSEALSPRQSETWQPEMQGWVPFLFCYAAAIFVASSPRS